MGIATIALIGALLGHAGTGVTDHYIHRIDKPLLEAADKVSKWIEKAMHAREADK